MVSNVEISVELDATAAEYVVNKHLKDSKKKSNHFFFQLLVNKIY